MNSKDIKRDIRSRHSRVSGDAPKIGRITRLRSAELPQLGVVRSRSRAGSRSVSHTNPALRKLIMIWSVVLGVAAFGVIIAAVSLWLLPKLRNHAAVVVDPTFIPDSRVRVTSRFPSPSEEEALRLVNRAMENRDIAKVPSLFRMGSANPEEVINFFKSSEGRDGAVSKCSWLSSMDQDGLLLEGVHVAFKGKDKPVERIAFLTPDEKGVWKMDFEAFARTARPSWNDLLENHAARATVRVFIGPDAYFNGVFSDETEWVCYGIASPDIDEVFHGYCRVGSPEAAVLEKFFDEGEKLSRATVELRSVSGAEPRQFEISRVLAKDWVVAAQNLTAENPKQVGVTF